MSTGWRYWFAFETRPGVMIASGIDLAKHWRALADSCRGTDGKLDKVEYSSLVEFLVEHSHLWGRA